MADVLITNDNSGSNSSGSFHNIVWASSSIGYFFWRDGDSDLVYAKTANGGATWSSSTTLESDTEMTCWAVWADWWTSGGTGNIVHIAFQGITTVRYIAFDVSDDTFTTSVAVVTHGADGGAPAWAKNASIAFDLDICKARGGNLLIVSAMNDGSSPAAFCYRSVDAGVTWTARAEPYESDVTDRCMLQPGDAADTNDFIAIFWDVSANEIDRKNYDDSGDSWDLTNIATAMDERFQNTHQFSVASRHSDNLSILVAINDGTTATCDLQAWAIGSASVTALTNVWTDEANHIECAVTINQNNDDIYVFYNGDGVETLGAVKIRYKKSTDGGSTWGSVVTYMEGAGTQINAILVDPSVGNTRAGLIAAAWITITPNPNESYINIVNAVSLGLKAVTLSGTIFGANEESIRAGGKTLILTLTGLVWDSSMGSTNTQTTALINGLDSGSSEALGWDAVVKAGLTSTNVTRNSDTVVTIDFPAFATYAITNAEIITATIESTSAS